MRRDTLRALREKQDTERKRQANLLAAWEKKFYWRYGDLRWSGDKIHDARTNRDMDRIEFALIYFPFNYVPDATTKITTPAPVKAPVKSAASTSLTLELPGYWGHLSYTIAGARLDPPTGSDRGNVGGRQYKGELAGNTLTISGNAVSDNPSSGQGSTDYYEIVVSVAVGKEKKQYGYIAPKGEKLNKPFSLSVPVTPGASGSFSISLLEQNANYGPHGWVVNGSLAPVTAGDANAKSSVSTSQSSAISQNVPSSKPAEAKTIFTTSNEFGVLNGGTSPSFVVQNATVVTSILTYHWNGGRGAAGGTIALKNSEGKILGPWKVSVRNNVYWIVNQQIKLPPGTYQVIDSDPSTWAQNSQTGGKGMVVIKGLER